MYIKEIDGDINEIASKICNNRYNGNYFDYWKDNIINFLKNGVDKKEQFFLLNIVKNIYWINEECYMFVSNSLRNINETYNNVYYVFKARSNSSNHTICSRLQCDMILSENNKIMLVEEKINKNTISKIEIKQILKSSCVVLVDDFVGTGDSLLEIIDLIEKNYVGLDVIIISYVWYKKSINYVKSKIDNKHNNYKIYNEEDIYEINDYMEIFKDSPDIIEYINRICCLCTKDEFKYGYKNSGLMLAINNLAPNNNISMIWLNKFKEIDWKPLLTRNVDYVSFQKRLLKTVKTKDLRAEFEKTRYKDKLSYEDFKALFVLFNSYRIAKYKIKEMLGLDSEIDVDNYIEKFTKNGIIKYEDDYLTFIDVTIINIFKRLHQKIDTEVYNSFTKKENFNIGIIN